MMTTMIIALPTKVRDVVTSYTRKKWHAKIFPSFASDSHGVKLSSLHFKYRSRTETQIFFTLSGKNHDIRN